MYMSDESNNKFYNSVLTCTGVAAGWESETYLRKWISKPVTAYIRKNIKNTQGGEYKSFVQEALRQNGLESNIKILDLNERNAAIVARSLYISPPSKSPLQKLLRHITRVPNNYSSFKRTVNGENAFFMPYTNTIVCNFEKFGAPVFHEIQHKLNETSKNNLIRTLAKIRSPLAFIGPLGVSLTAMLTDKKAKDKKEGIKDKIKQNCGWLTALSILPLTTEECIANIKGAKIAQKAGVRGKMLNKVKKIHRLSILSYCSVPIIAGIAVWSGNKIRDYICSYKKENKIVTPQYSIPALETEITSEPYFSSLGGRL